MAKDIKFKSKIPHTLGGKQLSIGQAVQYVVEEFLSTSLPERLDKLMDRLKSADL